MQFPFRTLLAGLFLMTSLFAAGCGTAEDANQANDPQKNSEVSPPDAHEHDHPSEGPHHGDLIELGNEEYHAELLHPEHGETSAVTIYILDSSAKKQVPIDAQSITVNVQHEGKPEQFTLAASPAEGDPEGQSSRFTSREAELLKHFGEEEIHGRLMVKINGKSYSGELAHEHHDH